MDCPIKMTETIEIKELDPNNIPPIYGKEEDYGGSKFVVIGKPGTGKSILIKSLLWYKSHIFPCCVVMSGSEDSNHSYQKYISSSFVYNKYSDETVKKFVERQKFAKQNMKNPWSILIVDDCTDDPKTLNSTTQQAIFKRGRHWNMMYILALQYCMDIKPSIRTNIDGKFILREPNLRNRKVLWENYASIIPTFDLFCQIMDSIANNYTALYINNATRSNEWTDCIFWYKAPMDDIPRDWKFGHETFWNHHKQRYDPDYRDSFEF